MSKFLKRCESGLLMLAGSCKKLLIVDCDRCQWAQDWKNNGCGSCDEGKYQGDWEKLSPPSLLEGDDVQEGLANTYVINKDADVATWYSFSFANATCPEANEVDGIDDPPPITSDPCDCTAIWWVTCHRIWNSGTDCSGPPDFERLSPAQSVQVALEDQESGCCEELYEPVPGVVFMCLPAGKGFCAGSGGDELFRLPAGPFCTKAEADTFVAAENFNAHCL